MELIKIYKIILNVWVDWFIKGFQTFLFEGHIKYKMLLPAQCIKTYSLFYRNIINISILKNIF